MPDEPIIDLQSDHYFMGEALRQAARAYEAAEVPIGAVIVRDGHCRSGRSIRGKGRYLVIWPFCMPLCAGTTPLAFLGSGVFENIVFLHETSNYSVHIESSTYILQLSRPT